MGKTPLMNAMLNTERWPLELFPSHPWSLSCSMVRRVRARARAFAHGPCSAASRRICRCDDECLRVAQALLVCVFFPVAGPGRCRDGARVGIHARKPMAELVAELACAGRGSGTDEGCVFQAGRYGGGARLLSRPIPGRSSARRRNRAIVVESYSRRGSGIDRNHGWLCERPGFQSVHGPILLHAHTHSPGIRRAWSFSTLGSPRNHTLLSGCGTSHPIDRLTSCPA